MVTENYHRLITGDGGIKKKKKQVCNAIADILTKHLQKCPLIGPLSRKRFFCPVPIWIGCHGNQNAKIETKMEYRAEAL